MKIKGKKLDDAMAAMDTDGSGEVEFDEFNKWWTEFGGKAADKRSAAGEADLSATDVQIERDEVFRCLHAVFAVFAVCTFLLPASTCVKCVPGWRPLSFCAEERWGEKKSIQAEG